MDKRFILQVSAAAVLAASTLAYAKDSTTAGLCQFNSAAFGTLSSTVSTGATNGSAAPSSQAAASGSTAVNPATLLTSSTLNDDAPSLTGASSDAYSASGATMRKAAVGNSANGSAVTMDAMAAPEKSAVHGFLELDFRNDYITPRGLLVTNRGLTMQPVGGLAFDLYDGTGCITNITANVGIWSDIDTSQHAAAIGEWNEFDWFAGVSATVFKDWTVGAEYEEFDSPPHNFRTEHNIELSLAYNDSPYMKVISIHPYAKLFYEASGDSTVVTGKAGNTFDVEVGIDPTYVWKIKNFPITLTAPTWVTVGPSEYWGGHNNFGVFSTGITATVPLTFVPKRLGNWHADVGVQYYHEINNELLIAQGLVGTGRHRDILVASAGIGMNF